MEIKNDNSTSEVENSKKDIEKFKYKFLVILGIGLLLVIIVLSIVLFVFKKDLGVSEMVGINGEKEVVLENLESLEKKEEQPIKKFADYDELKEFLENNSGENSYGVEGNIMMDEEVSGMSKATANFAPMETKMSESSSPRVSSGNNDYSKTNIQVAGVDEADIIKTDGNFIYAVSQKNLFIVDSKDPKNLNVLSEIQFENQPQDIYLNGDRLIIFGQNNEIYKKEIYTHFPRQSQYTFFKIFDISDRKNPKQLKNYDFEGNYSNSRMIGDYVYFLTNTYNATYIDEMPVPRVLQDEKDVYSLSNGKCLGNCPNVYYVDDFSNQYSMVNVMAINVKNVNEEEKSFHHEVYLMPSNQNLYVSQDNLYLTYTKHFDQNEFLTNLKLEIIKDRLTEKEKTKISKIKSSENFILNRWEKNNKIQAIVDQKIFGEKERKDLDKKIAEKIKEVYPQISEKFEQTIIHKIAIDKGNLKYQGFGAVQGTVLNQFSMDEKDGYFRIATTKNPTNWYFYNYFNYIFEEVIIVEEGINATESKKVVAKPRNTKSYNNLYILDKDLKLSGKIEKLAEGERIYSVRFMGDRAYMVTFKQTDPLFVISLKNPKDPKVLGELKIPGFSNYLHPYDENHLIGIGKDTMETEFGGVRTKGVKVALFDVANVEKPIERAKYVFPEGSDSIALHEHKAVLFDKEKNLLVIPLDLVKNYSRDFSDEFNGVAVFKISDKNIELRGKISHTNKCTSDYCYKYNYENRIFRSLWIENSLYTFSNNFIQANNLSNLEMIKKLELEKREVDDDFKVVN